MKNKVIFACLALVSSLSFSQELILHTASVHSTSKDKTYNNFNPGIGYRKDGISIGMYYNSYNRPTFYVGKEWMVNSYFGGWLAAATGYDRAVGRPITVIGGLIGKVPLTDTLTANVLLTPKFGDNPLVVHLAISKKL